MIVSLERLGRAVVVSGGRWCGATDRCAGKGRCRGDRVVVVVGVEGSIDRCLAEVHAVTGDLDRAIDLARAALALEDRLGAEPSAVRTSRLLAALLRRSGRAGADPEVVSLEGRARSLAEEIGCPGALWVPPALVA